MERILCEQRILQQFITLRSFLWIHLETTLEKANSNFQPCHPIFKHIKHHYIIFLLYFLSVVVNICIYVTFRKFLGPYLCQAQGIKGDCGESLLQRDCARTFRQTDSRKNGIPVEQLLVMSRQVPCQRTQRVKLKPGQAVFHLTKVLHSHRRIW